MGAPTVALVPFAALSEARFPENGGYIGPFHPSASAHYVVGLGPGLQSIHMLKTTSAAPADGDWDEQDTGIQLTSLSDCKHIWAQMNSAETLIEVMTSQDDGVIRRHSYTISSDTWTTSNELAAEVSATPTDPYSAAATNPMTVFGIESDGDINAAMLGERADASNNGFYSLERNGSWSLALSYTVNQAANGHVTTTANGPASGSGCNFLWNRTNSVCWRVRISVDSNNDSQEAIAAIPGLCAIGPGIIDSSDEVWFPYVDDTSSDLYVVHWPDSGNSTVTITQVGPISDQGDVAFNNATSQPWPCIHLGYDGTNVHGFYAAADGDLYWNKDASVTTGAEVELADGITCWNLSVAYDSNASEFW